MDQTRKFACAGIIGLIVVVVIMSAAGCTGPQRIVAPDAKEVSMAKPEPGEGEGFTLRATPLAKEQEKRLLGVDISKRAIVPVLFVLNNQTGQEEGSGLNL